MLLASLLLPLRGSFITVPRQQLSKLCSARCHQLIIPSAGVVPPLQPCLVTQCRRVSQNKYQTRVPFAKPVNFNYSGDLTYDLESFDPHANLVDYEGLLDGAPPDVKKKFSLEFASGDQKLKYQMRQFLKKVQKDSYVDWKAPEVWVAYFTLKLRNQIRHFTVYRGDKVCKSLIVDRIQKRKKILRKLRQTDYEKFMFLLKTFNIKYTPKAEYNRRLSRKARLKQEARNDMFAARWAKLAALRENLDSQKGAFLELKKQALADIENELKRLQITEGEALQHELDRLKVSL